MSNGQQITVEYIVKRPMKYGGRLLKQGDLFVPEGYKYDDKIMRGALTTRRTTVSDKDGNVLEVRLDGQPEPRYKGQGSDDT